MQKSRAVNLKQPKPSKVDKSQVECFFYKKLDHWKENYLAYIATLDPNRPKNKRKKQSITSQGTYMITPCNFSICDTTTQVLNIESPINICNLLQVLQVSRKFQEDQQFQNIGDGSFVPVLALGTLQLAFESSSIMLDDCYFYLSFLMNVISVGLLTKLGYKFIIKDDFCDIIMNDTIIMHR